MKAFYILTRLLPVVILLITSLGSRSQTVDLKLNLTKGEKYPYAYILDIEQELPQGPMKMSIGMGITMVVTGEEGTSKIIEASYQRFAMKMNMEQVSLDIDTDLPAPSMEDIAADPAKAMAKIFHAIKGQVFTMVVNAQGELVKVTGFEKIVDNVVDSATAWFNLPEAAKRGMRDGMSKQFNAKSVTDMMQQSFNNFPGKPVKVGDSWVKNIDTKGDKPNKMTTTYTVKSVGNNEVALSVQSQVDAIQSGDDIIMKGTQQGNMVIEIRTGMLIRSEITQDLTSESSGGPAKLVSKIKTERRK